MKEYVVPASIMLMLLAAPAQAQHVSFSDSPLGAKPKNFETALTGRGKPGEWAVVEDASAEGRRALAQLNSDPTDYRFPLAIYMPTVPQRCGGDHPLQTHLGLRRPIRWRRRQTGGPR
jgi:hypothetical protein